MKAAPIYSTVRNGSLRIDVRKYADGRYGFDYTPPNNGERVKVRLADPKAAASRARELVASAEGGVVQRFISDADEYALFLRWKAERKAPVAVSEMVKRFLVAKERKGVSGRHFRDLKFLTSFAEHFTVPINEVRGLDVEAWLDSREIGPRRWNNLRALIVSLWRYARAQALLPAEKTSVELIEKRKVIVTVKTFTPEDLRKILAVVGEDWLPVVALGAFAGIRPEELAPEKRGKKKGLRWENILWAKEKIDVPASVAKTGRRRFAPLLPAAAAFLSSYRQRQGFIAPETGCLYDHIARWVKRCGVVWKADGLRHSFASYRLAAKADLAALALEMGNSPDMIYRHYLDLKHEDEAAEWFGIRPNIPANVTQMIA